MEREKCHFRFPRETMTWGAGHRFGLPARGALMAFGNAINVQREKIILKG